MKNFSERARELLELPNLVILDTETTGLDNRAKIVQIAVIDTAGNVLFDRLVNPECIIPREAIQVHGITNHQVQNEPTFDDLFMELGKCISGKHIAIYNANYDIRLMCQSTRLDDRREWIDDQSFIDVMLPYAEHYGEWNDYHQNYRWQSLVNACRQQGVIVQNAHNALGDCQMTLALLKKLAGE